MSTSWFKTNLVTWQAAEPQLRAIRTEVFINEQHIPAALEWDGKDPNAIHAFTTDSSGKPIGTGRLLLYGELAYIGRMAVLQDWRGRGVGASLLHCLLDAARQRGATGVTLNSQTYAVPFYERFHFVRAGAEYLDGGIPHYRMMLMLD
jgi:predicted GNAT family N-acyltransferase